MTLTLIADCAEHDSSPTHRVKAARAAAVRATRPIQVIPVNYQCGQPDFHRGAQAQGSQAPGHPFRGHGGAGGRKGQRAGHGNGPAATRGTCLCLSTGLSVMKLCMHNRLGR